MEIGYEAVTEDTDDLLPVLHLKRSGKAVIDERSRKRKLAS